MKATNKQGHEWTGEKSEDGFWIYRDESGNLYDSAEVPAYRIKLNATQTMVDGRLAIVPLNHKNRQ